MPSTADEYIAVMLERGASDLLITAGAPATVRVDGKLVPVDDETLNPARTDALVRSLITEKQAHQLEAESEVDFSINWQDRCRLRANAFRQRGSLAIALRLIPYSIPTLDQLGVPASAQALSDLPHGLVLVTGATGSGKSTTLAAMIDAINSRRACHIVTIEDPLEYLHRHRLSVVDQREVGTDTKNFATALRSSLRQDPDVILVGEMRDLETIRAAITVAETGHLVFATLHTNDTAQAIDRMVDVFPADQQSEIRIQLASTLQGVIHQQLLAKVGGGRVAAFEVLIATNAVRNMIREGQTRQIRNVISTSGNVGMQTLERSVAMLVQQGVITQETARNATMRSDEIRG